MPLNKQEMGTLIDKMREGNETCKDWLYHGFDGFSWHFMKKVPYTEEDQKYFDSAVKGVLARQANKKLHLEGIKFKKCTPPQVTHQLFSLPTVLNYDKNTGSEIVDRGFDKAYIHMNSMPDLELMKVDYFPLQERFSLCFVDLRFQDAYQKLTNDQQEFANIYQSIVKGVHQGIVKG